MKNKDKNILVEFGVKIYIYVKYVYGCIFKIVLVLFKKKMLKYFSC